MEDGNVYVYDFSELREEVKNVETQISELVSVQSEQVSLQSEQAEIVQTQVSEIVSMYNENNELIMGSLIDITEVQTGQLVAIMLICGLLGLIIGICFVNIFKK